MEKIDRKIFEGESLKIMCGSNTLELPLKNIKGNIPNIINYLIYIFYNSGMELPEIIHELNKVIGHHADQYKYINIFENGK